MADRIELAHLPTPLEAAPRLAEAIGLRPDRFWIKRDDCTGLAGGGNKARKLEYLCAEALALGCDTLVTGGGRQSNHVRMTAAAANRLGLACKVVLSSDPVDVPTGNVVLDHALGADIVWGGPLDYPETEARIAEVAAELAAAGRRPYAMPIGGASTVGALGYVSAADELVGQLPDFDLVVTADGSGGTHAGLVAGLGAHDRVWGVSVGARTDLREAVPAKAAAVAEHCGRPAPTGTVQLDEDHVGAAYAAPTDTGRTALKLAAKTEGIVLDPVYTGKAMAGLIAAIADGRVDRDARVVFLHTGGLPALFARAFAAWITEA